MPSRNDLRRSQELIEELRQRLADQAANEAGLSRRDAEILNRELADLDMLLTRRLSAQPGPPDGGLAGLVGLGPGAAEELGDAWHAPDIPSYDDSASVERLLPIADLYYLYQHERMGIFRAVLKLQELFQNGQVRLSEGDGALALYRYDRRGVLRYTRKERLQAYRRVFGYTRARPAAGARPNEAFHRLFLGFNREVARYFRDQRISQVVRPDSNEPGFGSMARVRRKGLNLRGNLRGASYGHVNVLTVEVSQLLADAFSILGSDDVRRLFGADNAWDSLEDVLRHHLRETSEISVRARMAQSGREVLRWLARGHVLTQGATEFENLLLGIGEASEEWLTSAESVGDSRRGAAGKEKAKVVPLRRSAG